MTDDPIEGLHVQLILFEVPDEAMQDRLIGGIGSEVEAWVQYEPGFVSSTFHRSRDGRRVMNYARWRTFEDWRAFSGNARQSDIGAHIRSAGARRVEGDAFTVVRDFTVPAPIGTA